MTDQQLIKTLNQVKEKHPELYNILIKQIQAVAKFSSEHPPKPPVHP